MEAKKLGRIVVEIMRGDISAVSAAVIVNAANNSLWMGSGVAGALKMRGGPEIEREAMAKAPVLVGQAVETGAEKLKVDSIAMPALGTGVGAFPIKSCARLLFETLKKFDEAGPEYVKRVIFVLYTQKAFDDFEEYYRTI